MPEYNYSDLKKSLSSKSFSNVYLLSGDEYMVKYVQQLITDKILEGSKNDFNFSVFDGENPDIEQLSVCLETLPVITNKKCVVIRGFKPENLTAESINKIINTIEDIPPFAVLIITHSNDGSGSKISEKFKKIKKAVISCGTFTGISAADIPIKNQLISWAKKEYGKELSAKTAEIIKNRCQSKSITEIKNELKKICEFEDSDVITEDSIQILPGKKNKVNSFDLAKSIFSGGSIKAFENLTSLFEQGEDPNLILSAIAMQYIDIFRVKIFIKAGRDPYDITKYYDYKNKEFRIKIAEAHSKTMSLENISKSLEYIFNTDVNLKSTALNHKLLLSVLITNLINLKIS